MTVDIEAIARSQRCDASSLRLALPLLEQGYLPPFLARYRRDELGGIGESPLWSLLDAMRTEQRLQERREELLQRCRESEVADEAFQRVIQDARSQRVLDRVARRLRHEPSDPAQQLAARVLSPHRDDPAELAALAEQTVGGEAAEAATGGFERALTSRVNNDPRLMRAAVRWLAKNAKLKILEVSDPHIEENESQKQNENQSPNASDSSAASTPPADQQAEPNSGEAKDVKRSSELAPSTGAKPEPGAQETQPNAAAPQSGSEQPPAETQQEGAAADAPNAASEMSNAAPNAGGESPQQPAPATPQATSASQTTPTENAAPDTAASQRSDSESPASSDAPAEPPAAAAQSIPPADATKTDLPESAGESTPAASPSPVAEASSSGDASTSSGAASEQPAGDKAGKSGKAAAPAKAKKTKKKISPRQRRRRWLVSVLQPLQGKTLAPGKLTAFQTVMLGRALRSDVVKCAFQYDASQLLEQLIKTAEGFNRHHADQLRKIVQENEAKIRESAESAWWDELVDGAATRLVRVAADQLRRQMLREPVDARIVLAVDAVGPKTAAVAIVTADGRLLHTEDVPCQLSAAMRQQTVTRLGELVHQYHADLIVISNGPARRASLVVLSELLDQSQPGSLRWTLAERSGADLYANGPAGNREMRSTPRRFRAATWLAFQAVAPAQALTKVEATKLRLGSFQRELADEALAEALGDVIISGVSNDGVDTNGADQTWLARLPGMSEAVAEAIHRRRRKQLFATRSELTELSEWPDDVARNQAIAFLRVFQSQQPLDGTLIHPSDYALAEKLAKSLEIPLPPEMPPGYEPPSFDQPDHADDEQASPSAAEDAPAAAAATGLKEEESEAGAAESESLAPAPAKDTEGAASGDSASSQEPVDEAAGQEPSATPAGDAPAEERPAASDASGAVETPPTASDQAPADTPAADASAAENAAAANAENAEAGEEKGSEDASASDAGDEANDAEKDVTEIKSFRESAPKPTGEAEEKPAPPSVPEPYRHPTPDMEKVSRLAKEWQVGPHRARQIVRWLCDPFTSGSSPTIAAPSAVMQRVPKLAELKPGEQVSGVVVGVAPFGVFVELGPDCNGLIHVSKLSESYVEDLHEAVQVGDVLVAWVTGVDSKRRRVALSAVSPEREAELAEQRKQRRDGRRGGGRAGGGQRSGQRAASGGGRSGAGAGGGGGKGAPGGRRRDQPRRDRGRDGKRRDQGPRTYTKVSKSEAAPPPLTEAMQKGDEPLRTFGDLMQFFQQGKQEQKKKSVEPKTLPANEAASKQAGSETSSQATPEEQARPADAQAASNEPTDKSVDQGSDSASHDPAVEANRNSETSQDR